ncbi:tyrosine-protein phosphatase [Devosia riboflavina]|uniref:tyrosine-protein phosphatase n=1 Tax=Devosia riboflavina TaxID=46914 RepID=UPI00136435BE|nr:tyrosine-protein phosphatase [Devosia riboflavina]
MTLAAPRHWPLPDTHNVRDLGGYASRVGGTTQWRRILRGEALHPLTEDSRAELVDGNLSLVIDLRGPHETGIAAHPFGDHPSVAYRNIVLFDALSPIAMAQQPFDMAERYCEALDRCGARFAEVFRAVIEAKPGIVLFHCTAGKDRTGVVAAMLLATSGVSHEDIAADYALTASAGGLIDHLRNRALAAGTDPRLVERMLASDAETMEAFLAYLDGAHGGIEAYLQKIGLTAIEITALRDRLCT